MVGSLSEMPRRDGANGLLRWTCCAVDVLPWTWSCGVESPGDLKVLP